MRRFLALAAVAAFSLMLLLPAADSASVSAASTSPFGFNWPGGLTVPVLWAGQGPGSNWDVQIHKRAVGDAMDAMAAQHGADCAPPPATHPINTLAQGVYICKHHLMPAINDAGYRQVVLTPDHMVDVSAGTAAVTVSVSTLQLNLSDWIEIWITPFGENLTTPSSFGSQGAPSHGLRFSLSRSGILATSPGDVVRFDNFAPTALPKTGAPSLAALVPSSAVTRTNFEIDLSQTHVRFGLPGVGAGGTWWTDTNIAALPFTQGIVQITHHSYDPNKHCPS